MTVRGFLDFIADLRQLEGARRTARLDYVIGRLQLESVLEQTVETLSKGFRRRVGLAQAIVHDPPVLILDEPTDGLDPNQKHEVRQLIDEMARDKIIVISTHILEEVDGGLHPRHHHRPRPHRRRRHAHRAGRPLALSQRRVAAAGEAGATRGIPHRRRRPACRRRRRDQRARGRASPLCRAAARPS